MPQLDAEQVSIDKLFLDPNNYRFQNFDDFVQVDQARVREDSVQARARTRLREIGLSELKNSILKNGFLPFEQIVVTPHIEDPESFVVIEGNRRVAALKWLKEDHAAGVDVPQEVVAVFNAVPVVVATELDESFRISLMGVRHVGGIKPWGNYQRAKLVAELKDKFEYESSEVAARLGMSAHEVNRRYRAFKALEQMMEDEEYGDLARTDMYVLFHEAVAGRAIKEWLGWSESESCFRDDDNLRLFYELIAPQPNEDGEAREPKLSGYDSIRSLRDILPVPEAKRLLLDTSTPYAQALGAATADALARNWITEIGEANQALKKVGAVEIGEGLDAAALDALRQLKTTANTILELHSRLHPTDG